ncbi:MAG: coproporphyrinogen dehydrogenase HemZ [Clostridia bacterium]|nr:coproporphyrinogen dehydrogenase HemZ [Clostridia bacterium]
MKLYIDGDINRYFVQTLCMIYFPGAKFSENEPETENTPVVRISVRYDESYAYAEAHMSCEAGQGHGTGKAAINESRTISTSAATADLTSIAGKFAVGGAMLEAGEMLFGDTPPWGMLTGVRPAKISCDLLSHAGLNRNEAEEWLRRVYRVSPKKASLVTAIAERENEIIDSLGKNTCSLYISIPFCPSRCAYCSFVSYSTKRLLSMIPEYLVRLERDLRATLALIERLGQKVVTVYIGGGTPGILEADQLRSLLSIVNEHCPDLREFTYEAGRPETITPEKLSVAKEYGVTRVSINPQTTNDTVLESIGRRHTTAQFYEAYEMAVNSGIKHINADLIAGLPGDTFTSFSRSMDSVIRLDPSNITVHTFCVKKSADVLKNGSEIYSRSGGDTAKSVDYSQVAAMNAGYNPYYIYRQKNTVGNFENVGFAKPGAEGLYNIFIMEEIHSIFAVGAGATTKAVSPSRNAMERFFMPKYPYEYLRMDEDPEQFKKFERGIEEFYAQHFS